MRLLFVCTGNTCRSPAAEGLARQLLHDRSILDVEVGSAGTSAWEGASGSDGSMLVALERGIDLSGHRARQLTSELVRDADLILAMGPHHLERAEALGGTGKTYLLATYASNGASQAAISDPFGGDLDVYRVMFDEMERAMGRVLDRVVAERGSST